MNSTWISLEVAGFSVRVAMTSQLLLIDTMTGQGDLLLSLNEIPRNIGWFVREVITVYIGQSDISDSSYLPPWCYFSESVTGPTHVFLTHVTLRLSIFGLIESVGTTLANVSWGLDHGVISLPSRHQIRARSTAFNLGAIGQSYQWYDTVNGDDGVTWIQPLVPGASSIVTYYPLATPVDSGVVVGSNDLNPENGVYPDQTHSFFHPPQDEDEDETGGGAQAPAA